jgi:hypothetical protein
MKIRNGFVTNSSSTSFILSMKEEFTEENFISALGAEGDSPLNKIFEDLFKAVEENAEDIISVVKKEGDQSVEKFLEGSFSKETISKVNEFLEAGRKVYYGRLHSDCESAAEQYFCCESFILMEDDIYFNGNIGGW